MREQVGSKDFLAMMRAAARLIREQQGRLSQLDCVAGDGDHGSTMVRIMSGLEAAFNSDLAIPLRQCFSDAGWKVMNSDGGASSSLLGAFFLGIGEAAREPAVAWDCAEVAGMFEAGLKAVEAQTRARVGDKTLMDALAPAVDALRAAANAGRTVAEAVQAAADAAQAGANATENMIAHYGRARLLGENTLGHQDAGAASIALMFQGFCQAMTETKGSVAHARY
jgi:phosphoenolpyruvate---glycerone phosphotransferase subunit DhaL